MDPRDARLKKLAFRSRHMGTAENDHLFSTFAARHLDGLDAAEVDQYEALLAVNDVALYKWITGAEPVPSEHDNRVMDLLKIIKNDS